MIFFKKNPIEKEDTVDEYKLYNMLSFLKHTTSEFEAIADNVQDKDFEMALRSIAVETKQYANELDSQLKCMGVNFLSPQTQFTNEDVSLFAHRLNIEKNKKSILAICNQSELFFITAYQDILKLEFAYPFLKGIINSQFNGIKSAFMKMKLLNMVKFN